MPLPALNRAQNSANGAMESSLVIKVKYGDTLRRFNAYVNENNQLDLDIVGLRAKILSLFNFSADANLILRYVDEDGDLVTLVDDDDLHDLTRQRLKFWRIDVHVSNDIGGQSNAMSSGSATPLTSRAPDPFLSGNVIIAPDALKSVPVALREAASKLAIDLVSYIASGGKVNAMSSGSATPLTSPPIPNASLSGKVAAIAADALKSVPEQLHEAVSKLSLDMASNDASGGKSNARSSGSPTPLRSSSAPKVATAADASKSVPEPLREAVSKLSIDLVSHIASSTPDFISKMGLNSHYQTPVAAGPSSKNVPEESVTSEAIGPQPAYVGSTSNASQQMDAGNVTRGVVAGVASVDFDIPPCVPYSSQSTNVNTTPFSSAVPDGDGKKGKTAADDSFASKGESTGASSSSAVPNNSTTQTTPRSSSAFVDCPFSGTYTFDLRQPILGKHIYPFKRSHSHTEATSGMFHKGVRCDGCGVYPITGPRFKSKVKENYDLCSICFNEMGNETDYIRMDRPMSGRGPRCLRGVYEHPPWSGAPTIPPIFKAGAAFKHAKPKLDSRFILDVNVIDGTMMAPSTAFTKIWRVRNNGTLVWPEGTQLVWIGGDDFSDSHSVYVEVSEDGVPVDKELDIAVDFRAPQLPGRYVSYWRMASPSGQKFGQRVWVLIQVDASLKDSFYDSSQGLNLNIPLDVSGSKGHQIIDINVQPIEDDAFLRHLNPTAPTEPVNQTVVEHPRQEVENEFHVNEATCGGPAASRPSTSVAPSSISYPVVDFSETAPAVPYPSNSVSETVPAVPSGQLSPAVDAPSSSLEIGGNDSVEETLLKELEEMGFRQIDLNKEILRMNEYNLEQSVDDLCGVSEWDPILEELQEMGFRDDEMNKRLLKKNNGSIKRVVMDLINGGFS